MTYDRAAIMTRAHEIARNLGAEGSYHARLAQGLRLAWGEAKNTMTTDDAREIITEAADAHDQETEAVWDRLIGDGLGAHPSAAGPYAAYKSITQMLQHAIDAVDTDADVDEMAEALRGEIKRRADEHDHVTTMSRLDASDVIEASYIWCRGETGEVTMDTELTFGKHEGKTIKWLFENDRDYANWIVSEMKDNRPHLATFIAMEEDKRREDNGGYYVFCRGDECIA